MKHIIFVLAVFISVTAFAQDDILVKTDGTKYYLQIYDGETNEKVLRYEDAAGWQYKIFTAEYFTGSNDQLWSFEATEMFPGYFSIVNQELTNSFHLMSYNWLAYFSDADNRDPKSDKEMQFKFEKVTDEYYKLITIEKPTDGSLYGIDYTPGADALNVDENGRADFGDVKSADITPDNMVNMVFKVVEFNPMALFEESIVRGDDLYNDNINAPEKVRYDLFYILEKAREVRVFGTEGEMLAFQPSIDGVVAQFNQTLGLLAVISDARAFIDASSADDEVKSSFNAIVDEAEEFINSDDLNYTEIDAVQTKLGDAKSFVEAIVAAQTFDATLVDQDARLSAGMTASIDAAKSVLADLSNDAAAYSSGISHLDKTQELINEIIAADGLIAATQEFEEAKEIMAAAIESAMVIVSNPETSVEGLTTAIQDIQNATKEFKRALEAGDTVLVLKNADFAEGLADWNVESPTPGAAYPENKGVDGSRSITFWKGADYQMKVFQSISNIPNGTYQLSCFANISADNTIALFAESGETSSVLPLVGEGVLTKRLIEIEVTNGKLDFGIKGAGENNGIPAGNWIVFDQFEIKWMSKSDVPNAGFEDGLNGWTAVASPGVPYIESKGVDGSKSVTCWKGGDYFISLSQTLSGIANGTYAVSAMTKGNEDNLFVVFGSSGGSVSVEPVLGTDDLVKTKVIVQVTDGTLELGIKGAGENNSVPAGRWIVFDNFEVVRLPDVPLVNPNFDEDFAGWFKESPAGWMPYIENKGVDGSKSVTFWYGSDYHVITKQTVSGLFNGSYEVSAMTNSPNEGSFAVFGASGSDEFVQAISQTEALEKQKVLATVSDGTLEFGIRGAGEGNTASAGDWVVFDNFQILIKSIIPNYETPVIEPIKAPEVNKDLAPVNEIKYWQASQKLMVRSNKAIVNYAVYSITGAKVDQKQTNNHQLSIPMRNGVYIVRVLTEDGFVDTEKIIIR